MKTMFTLSELATKLQANEKAKADYVMPAAMLEMEADGALGAGSAMPAQQPNDLGHRQIAEYTGIPAIYYDRMRHDDKGLLSQNVNRWLRDKKPGERRMVRTLDGNVRALLSDSYKRIDNGDVAEQALNVLADMKHLRIVSTAITEQRLYIKAVRSDIVRPDPGKGRVGQMVEAGIVIGNSEVGLGSFFVEPFANFLFCTNGMSRKGEGLRAAHVGKKVDASLEGALSNRTKLIEDAALMSRMRDILLHSFDAIAFGKFMDKLTDTTKQQISGSIDGAVEALGSAQTLGLNIGERQSVLRHLIQGGDLSRYGLINAVTRTAEDVPSYDRASEIEALGWQLAEMPATQWGRISNAKPLELIERVAA